MKALAEYQVLAAAAHGHMCAGQILGLRMAMHGLELLGVREPEGKDRKRLVTFVEIDRCATDAIPVITGCRLGKRALKFRDFGKVTATFCDLQTQRSLRVVALESSKERAREQLRAYREMDTGDLFDHQWVRVKPGPEGFPGYKGACHICAECGEGINFERQVMRDGITLCKACAGHGL